MLGEFQGAEQQRLELRPIAREWTEQPRIVRTVGPETRGRLLHRAFDNYGRAIIKRMREGRIGLNEGEAVLGKRQRAEKRGRERERYHCSANIVDKSGPREFRRTHTSADSWLGFEDQHRLPSLRERYRCRKPIGSRTNYHGIELAFRMRHAH